jgi:hypothetical protein
MMMDTANSQEECPSTHGLIVDFPCKSRISPKSEGIVSTAPKSAQLRVCFSKFSELVIIPYDDAKLKWYTQEEQRLFRQSRLADVRRLRDMLRDSTSICEEVLYECLGIENMLFSYDVLRYANQKKQAHSSAVLLTQSMHQGDHSRIEELSETSKKSSRWARERAALLAALHAKSSL